MQNLLQTLTLNSFLFGFLAMTGAAIFMALQQNNLLPRFRAAASTSVVILTIAAISYYYMFGIYQKGVEVAGSAPFPTQVRYVDWILTTPLLLLEFPLLLGMGKRGRSFMTRLVVLDVLMIVFAYISETSPNFPPVHYGFFLLSCICWLAIAALMLNALQSVPPTLGLSLRQSLKFLSFLFLVGWAIYPLGFLTPLMQIPQDIRELVYNIADVINKVGPALAIYIAARGTEQEEAEYAAEHEAAGYEEAS